MRPAQIATSVVVNQQRLDVGVHGGMATIQCGDVTFVLDSDSADRLFLAVSDARSLLLANSRTATTTP